MKIVKSNTGFSFKLSTSSSKGLDHMIHRVNKSFEFVLCASFNSHFSSGQIVRALLLYNDYYYSLYIYYITEYMTVTVICVTHCSLRTYIMYMQQHTYNNIIIVIKINTIILLEKYRR